MALVLEIKVVPSSGQNKWVLDKTDHLKCYLKSAPERGKANKELIQILSKVTGISQAQITIMSGLTTRNKKVKLDADITLEKFLDLVSLTTSDKQQGLF